MIRDCTLEVLLIIWHPPCVHQHRNLQAMLSEGTLHYPRFTDLSLLEHGYFGRHVTSPEKQCVFDNCCQNARPLSKHLGAGLKTTAHPLWTKSVSSTPIVANSSVHSKANPMHVSCPMSPQQGYGKQWTYLTLSTLVRQLLLPVLEWIWGWKTIFDTAHQNQVILLEKAKPQQHYRPHMLKCSGVS